VSSAGIAMASAVLEVAAGLILLQGAVWKLRNRRLFHAVLATQGRATRGAAGWLVVLVPAAESVFGVSGVLLVLPPGLWPLPVLSVLLPAQACFGALLVAHVLGRIRAGSAAACGCLNAEERFGWPTVVRAGLIPLGGVAGAVVVISPPHVDAGSWSPLVAAAATMIALSLTVGLRAVTSPSGAAAARTTRPSGAGDAVRHDRFQDG